MKNRTLLMIPGPIEFDAAVLAAMGAPTTSHVAPDFIEAFGQSLERMRTTLLSTDGQPFIVTGSGTLAMELAGANLIEPGDRALVVNTGYFGDRFAALLEHYGAHVKHTHERQDFAVRHRIRYDFCMTYDESMALIKDLMSAKSKEDLQLKMGENMTRVDGTFFTVVGQVTTRLRAQGKNDAAQALSSISDSLARLRFMI